jgi:hypothetical protein
LSPCLEGRAAELMSSLGIRISYRQTLFNQSYRHYSWSRNHISEESNPTPKVVVAK